MKTNRKLLRATMWLLFLYFIHSSNLVWADQFSPIVPGLQLSSEVTDGVATDIQFADLVKKASEDALQNEQLNHYFNAHFKAGGAYGELNNGTLAANWDNLAKAFGLSVTTLLGAYALWRGRKRSELEALTSGNQQDIEDWLDQNIDLETSLSLPKTGANFGHEVATKNGTILKTISDWSDFLTSKGLRGVSAAAFFGFIGFWRRKKHFEHEAPDEKYAEVEKILEKHVYTYDGRVKTSRSYYSGAEKEVRAEVERQKVLIEERYREANPEPIAPEVDDTIQYIMNINPWNTSNELKTIQTQLYYRYHTLTPQSTREIMQGLKKHMVAHHYYRLNPQDRYQGSYSHNWQMYKKQVDNLAILLRSRIEQLPTLSYQEKTTLKRELQYLFHPTANQAQSISYDTVTQARTEKASYEASKQTWDRNLETEKAKANELMHRYYERYDQYWSKANQKNQSEAYIQNGARNLKEEYQNTQTNNRENHREQFKTQLQNLLEHHSWEDLIALKDNTYESTDDLLSNVRESLSALESGSEIAQRAFLSQFEIEDLEAKIKEKEAYLYKQFNDPYHLRYRYKHWYWPNINRARNEIASWRYEINQLKEQHKDFNFGSTEQALHLYQNLNHETEVAEIFTVESPFRDKAIAAYKDKRAEITTQYRSLQFVRQLEHLGKDNDYFRLGYEHLSEIQGVNNQLTIFNNQLQNAQDTKERYELEDKIKALNERKEALTQDLFNLKSVADGLVDIDFIDEPIIEDWESAQSSHYQRLLEQNPVYQHLQNREKKKAFYTKYNGDLSSYDFVTLAESLEDNLRYFEEHNTDGRLRFLTWDNEQAVLEKVEAYKAYRNNQLPEKKISFIGRYGHETAAIPDYKDAHWDQLWKTYHYWKGIPNGQENTQEAIDAIRDYQEQLHQTRGEVWESQNTLDLEGLFSTEEIETYQQLKAEWTRTQEQETITIETEEILEIPPGTNQKATTFEISAPEIAQELKEPLEVALQENTYDTYAKVFAEQVDAVQAASLLGALATLTPPPEPEIPDGGEAYKLLVNQVDQTRIELEDQDKLLRNTVIRRQNLERTIRSTRDKAMDYYDAWRKSGTNQDYNLYLRYNAQLREQQNTLKELTAYEAEVRTTLHQIQDDFNQLQANLGREQTSFARYDNLLTIYNQEKASYEKEKARITQSVADKYAYLKSKARTYYQAAQNSENVDQANLVEIVEADIAREEESKQTVLAQEVVITAQEVPKDLYDLYTNVQNNNDIVVGEWLQPNGSTSRALISETLDIITEGIIANVIKEETLSNLTRIEQIAVLEHLEQRPQSHVIDEAQFRINSAIIKLRAIIRDTASQADILLDKIREGDLAVYHLSNYGEEEKRLTLSTLKKQYQLWTETLQQDQPNMAAFIEDLEQHLVSYDLKEDLAHISKDVYNLHSTTVRGYQRLNESDYGKYGLTSTDLINDKTGLQAAIYENEDNIVVAFAGTQNLIDILNDIQQGIGVESKQYEAVKKITDQLYKNNNNKKLIFTGHSLGGGLAATAGAIANTTTVTFNAAGVHPNTLDHYNGIDNYNITNFTTKNDILTDIQQSDLLGPVQYVLPDALGVQVGAYGNASSDLLYGLNKLNHSALSPRLKIFRIPSIIHGMNQHGLITNTVTK